MNSVNIKCNICKDTGKFKTPISRVTHICRCNRIKNKLGNKKKII